MTLRPETIAVHGGQQADPTTNSVAVPIYQTASYAFNDTQHAAELFALSKPGNIYTRITNPTWSVLEERMAQLEGGVAALALASGQAANTYALLNVCRAGDNVIATGQLYGGTYNLFAHTLPQFGIEVRFVDADDPSAIAARADDKTRLVFGETIGNPRLNVLDIPAWSQAAHALGLPLAIDNTVATPYGCQALAQGADIVTHSLTKYLGGHGTSLGGVVVDGGTFPWADHADRYPLLAGPDPSYHGAVWTDALGPAAYVGRIRTVMLRNLGAALSPFNAFLILQGIETLSLRMERHNQNAGTVARWLTGHDRVEWVYYPGLDGDPYKQTADKVLADGFYGGLVTFGVKGGIESGRRFIESLELFSHLANIGDAKSLAIHNATTTHSQLSPQELASAGVTEDTVRLSIGIEHADDIIADLDQALAASAV